MVKALTVYIVQGRQGMVKSFYLQTERLFLSQFSLSFIFGIEIPHMGVSHAIKGFFGCLRLHKIMQMCR